MLDDPDEVTKLIESMKSLLPISAYPTNNLCHSLRNEKNIKLKTKQLLKIKDVLNMGDEGGIVCAVSHGNTKEALLVSLTHLQIKKIHPLAKEIRVYQMKRKQKLAGM